MSISQISALPPAPLRTDTPATFSDKADVFVQALSTLVTETNATVAEINTALAGAFVQFNAYQGDWVAGSYASGDVVRASDGLFYISTAAANANEPPGTNWVVLNSAAVMAYTPTNVALTSDNVQGAIDELCTLPPSAQAVSYTLVAADTGGLVTISDGTLTVPPSVFSAGDVVSVYNNSGTNRPIARGAGVTMYWINAANADRTLGPRGVATILCVAADTFVITGQGLS